MASSSCFNISNEADVLKVTIHSCENFSNVVVMQPTLCMHVIDEKTGTYVKKSDRNRPVVSFYENQRDDLDYIMPVMTQSCFVSAQKSTVFFRWEEVFILNEQYDMFVNENSRIILFFEIIDLIPVSVIKHSYERLNPNGMHKLAWAFLKIRGSNDVINTGSNIRLQLYKPFNSYKKKKAATVVEIYDWWLKKPRASLEASLFISIEPFRATIVEPALRSFLPIQQEKGSTCFAKLSGFDTESLLNFAAKSNSISLQEENTVVTWSRKKGEPCKIPTKRTLLLDVINSCQILKFSHSGRMLAAGCGTQGCYYLMVYQIPEGNIILKLLAHSEVIYDLDWICNDNYLLSASGDYNVKMWNVNHWNLVASFVHPSFVYSAKFHPTDPVLASACYDHIVRIWDIEKKTLLKELEAHNSTVCSLSWNAGGTKLYSIDGLSQIKIWTKSRKNFYELNKEINLPEIQDASISKIIVDSNEENLYLFCSDSGARILYLANESILSLESDVPFPKFSKGCCSPCGNLIFLNNGQGDVSVWDKRSGINCFENIAYNLNYGYIACLEYHPHENMLAFCFWDDAVPIHIYLYEINGNDNEEAVKIKREVSTLNEISNNVKSTEIKTDYTPIEVSLKFNMKNSNRNAYVDRAVMDANLKAVSNNPYEIDESPSDLFLDKLNLEGHQNELPTTVITNDGQFDVIAIADDTTCSDSSIFRNLHIDPVIPTKSSKRSQRRKKLKELNKAMI